MRADPDAAEPAPDLDEVPIDPDLSRRAAPAAWSAAASQAQAVLQIEHAGHTITLEDCETVGTGGDPYRSWLPARTAASAPSR